MAICSPGIFGVKSAVTLEPLWKRVRCSCAEIQAVAIDMWPAFIDAVTNTYPTPRLFLTDSILQKWSTMLFRNYVSNFTGMKPWGSDHLAIYTNSDFRLHAPNAATAITFQTSDITSSPPTSQRIPHLPSLQAHHLQHIGQIGAGSVLKFHLQGRF